MRTPNLRFRLKLKHKREPAASQRERVYTQDGRSHTRPLVSGAGAPPGWGMARVLASQDGLGEEEDWSRAPRGGADKPAGWVCILSVLPRLQSQFSSTFRKRLRKKNQEIDSQPLGAVQSCLFPPAGVHCNFKSPGGRGVRVMKERRRRERTSSNASWIHKLIIAADMQILNSISSFVFTRLLFHLACCRIPY